MTIDQNESNMKSLPFTSDFIMKYFTRFTIPTLQKARFRLRGDKKNSLIATSSAQTFTSLSHFMKLFACLSKKQPPELVPRRRRCIKRLPLWGHRNTDSYVTAYKQQYDSGHARMRVWASKIKLYTTGRENMGEPNPKSLPEKKFSPIPEWFSILCLHQKEQLYWSHSGWRWHGICKQCVCKTCFQ